MRKSMCVMVFLAALFVLTPSVFAAPLGIREITIGMSKEEVVDALENHKGARCYDDYNYCQESTWIKRGAQVTYFFGKHKQKLTSIHIRFLSKFSDVMLEGLVEKYGKPTKTFTETWQNRAGAAFDNNVSTWVTPDGAITIKVHGEDFNDGEISMVGKITDEEISTQKEKDKSLPGF